MGLSTENYEKMHIFHIFWRRDTNSLCWDTGPRLFHKFDIQWAVHRDIFL